MDLAHRQGNPLLRFLPREHADFGLWRQQRRFQGDGVWVRRDVGQDQDGRLAIAHKIAGDGEDEIGVGAVHPGQEFVDHLHRDFGPAPDQVRAPAFYVGFVEEVAGLRARSRGLSEHGSDCAIGRALQEVPDEGAANAEAPASLSELGFSRNSGAALTLFGHHDGLLSGTWAPAPSSRVALKLPDG